MKTKIIRLKTLALAINLVVFCVLTPAQLSYAQHRVVVVPLFADDVVQEVEPTAPVAKVSPTILDYTVMGSTVIDKITGLEWQREDDNDTKTWNEALDYCANEIGNNGTFSGHNDWRLPDIFELQSIVDYGKATDPAIQITFFPNTDSSEYWSASGKANDSARAWDADFGNGVVFSNVKTNLNFVRCVR